MKKYRMNYESLLKVTKALSMSKDPKEIIRITVDNIRETLNMKGCALYLINEGTSEFVYDTQEDPRVQYPEAAQKEGVVSILSVPIYVRGEVIGAMRVYTSEHWDFTLEDVNFVQALAEIAGMVIDLTRLIKGQNEYIDVLETLKETREM